MVNSVLFLSYQLAHSTYTDKTTDLSFGGWGGCMSNRKYKEKEVELHSLLLYSNRAQTEADHLYLRHLS